MGFILCSFVDDRLDFNMLKAITIREEREKKHFNNTAADYESKYGYDNKFTKFKIKKKVNSLVKQVDSILKTRDIKILEIGCGTGTYTLEIIKQMPKSKIFAIDISEEMIKIAQKKVSMQKNVKYKVTSAYNTGFEDSSIDVVCGFYTLHHLDFEAVRKEIFRVLKRGGLAYFYEPNILNPVVFMIKSSKMFKKLIGDSLDEWAINPLKTASLWEGFRIVEVKTSEFVWPFQIVPYNLNLFLDKITSSLFLKVPVLNMFGGSVKLCLVKK